MLDVLIAGAGPAGAVTALLLARAGARVLVIDRASFPRDKLCGDTLNPGAVRLLARLGLSGGALDRALPIGGMRLTGPRTSVSARYGGDVRGLAIRRRDLDAWLLEQAVNAGARFESGFIAREALVDRQHGQSRVRGLVLERRGRAEAMRMPAMLTIAADGRRSAVGRSLNLIRRDTQPRRWAYGVYAVNVDRMTDLGEMHVRGGWYVGLAPLPDGLVNVCVVRRPGVDRAAPPAVIRQAIASEPELAARFQAATFETKVRVLGPLAATVRAVGLPGLLLAGDASGFVDPMTGDGLHLAMQSAELAAAEALHALETGEFAEAPARLLAARRTAFGAKLRFNRIVRRLVDSPRLVSLADAGARAWPGAIAQAVRYAGDAA